MRPISVKINRQNGQLSSVRVTAPVWTRQGNDSKLYVNMPLFGMETYGWDEADLNVSIKEALTCFFIASEKYGKGVENELELSGWTRQDNQTFGIVPPNDMFADILSTGRLRTVTIDMLANS